MGAPRGAGRSGRVGGSSVLTCMSIFFIAKESIAVPEEIDLPLQPHGRCALPHAAATVVDFLSPIYGGFGLYTGGMEQGQKLASLHASMNCYLSPVTSSELKFAIMYFSHGCTILHFQI